MFINWKFNLISFESNRSVVYWILCSIPEVTVSILSASASLMWGFLLFFGKVQASVVISCNVTDCTAFLSFFPTTIYPLASCIWQHRQQKSLCACVCPGVQRKLTSGVDQVYANALFSPLEINIKTNVKFIFMLEGAYSSSRTISLKEISQFGEIRRCFFSLDLNVSQY